MKTFAASGPPFPPAIGLMLALCGCVASSVGVDFSRPSSTALLGTATVAQVEQQYGAPTTQTETIHPDDAPTIGNSVLNSAFFADAFAQFAENTAIIPSPSPLVVADSAGAPRATPQAVFKEITYIYAPSGSEGINGDHSAKRLTFAFRGDVLQAYSYIDFLSGPTDMEFDNSRVAALARGRTTIGEALAAFGPPDGAERLRFAQIGTWFNVGTSYQYRRRHTEADGETTTKSLDLTFNARGVLYDFRYTENTARDGAQTVSYSPPIVMPHYIVIHH